ncbi:hypothetical protein [Yersinia pekkanenii]|uniref:Uncharacterized protein n=1 Tax=Yersinia pekkanenii TaxID=1288385 RepID=A0ABM9TYU4_9GAMM|nr:hypothetical protein [Yersinia pekkanenii]CRY69096.1 Uncharacterised protein [Yersinia pekkanenii]
MLNSKDELISSEKLKDNKPNLNKRLKKQKSLILMRFYIVISIVVSSAFVIGILLEMDSLTSLHKPVKAIEVHSVQKEAHHAE